MFITKIDYSVNKDKYNSYNHEIERFVPADSLVLDIGCATGRLAEALARKGCRIVGVDIDEASLKSATKFCQSVHKVDIDDLKALARVLKDKKFDAITLGDILEHLKYPGSLLYSLKQFLKPGGTIIASIPNAAFIWCRARFIMGNFNYVKTGGLMDEDHLRLFSFKTARSLFEDAGLDIVRQHGISNVRPLYGVLRSLAKIWPTMFAIQIIMVARGGK